MKQIKSTIILAVALLSVFHGFTQVNRNAPDKIIGLYWSPEKDAKIQIFKTGDKYYGKSVWLSVPHKDSKNPNEALSKRDLLGTELLSNFSFKDEAYIGGTIYDPESGKTYNCKMSLEGKFLRVRGYVGISLFGRTEIFERIN